MATEQLTITIECDFRPSVVDREKNQVGDNSVIVVTFNGYFLCVGPDLAQAKRNAQAEIQRIFDSALTNFTEINDASMVDSDN